MHTWLLNEKSPNNLKSPICTYKMLKCLLCALGKWMWKYFAELKSAVWLLIEDSIQSVAPRIFFLLTRECYRDPRSRDINNTPHTHLAPIYKSQVQIHPAQGHDRGKNLEVNPKQIQFSCLQVLFTFLWDPKHMTSKASNKQYGPSAMLTTSTTSPAWKRRVQRWIRHGPCLCRASNWGQTAKTTNSTVVPPDL